MTPNVEISVNLAPARHGFFKRVGGYSNGIYAGLNCGLGSDDNPKTVQKNRNNVATQMGIRSDNLLSLLQIHSNKVVTLTAAHWSNDQPRADAMVTDLPDIGLGILTADCAPVLFNDPVAKIIGAAHAGWKGALYGIVDATIDAMTTLGAKRENIHATVGPCISQSAYEVGQEFMETFVHENHDYSQFFADGQHGKYQFDLPMFVMLRLKDQGIMFRESLNKCTYTLDTEYFSYRRTTHKHEPDYGRQISVITNSKL